MSEFNIYDEKTLEDFNRWAFRPMLDAGWISSSRASSDPQGTADSVAQFVEDFINEFEMKFVSVEDARSKFGRWLQRRPLKVPDKMIVSVSRTYTFGKEQITFGLSGEFDVPTMNSRKAASGYLLGQVAGMYDDWARNHANAQQAQRSASDSQVPSDSAGDGTQVLEASAVRKENKQGKNMYAVLCGRYTQHGVPIYEEVMKVSDPTWWRALDYGDTPVKGTCTVQYEGGKVKRVIKVNFA